MLYPFCLPRDSVTRLVGSFISYDNKLFYVTNITGYGGNEYGEIICETDDISNGSLDLYYEIKGKIYHKDGSSETIIDSLYAEEYPARGFSFNPRIDCSPIPLGYVYSTSSHNGEPIYVSRIPRRRWVQGLASGSIMAVHIGQEPRSYSTYSYGDPISKECFTLPYYDNYPASISELKSIKEVRGNGVCLSRSFAVGRSGRLYYKGWEVGGIDSSLQPSFITGNSFIEQVFKEEVSWITS